MHAALTCSRRTSLSRTAIAPARLDLVFTTAPGDCRAFAVRQDTGLLSDHLPLHASFAFASPSLRLNAALLQQKREKWRSADCTPDDWAAFRASLAAPLTAWLAQSIAILHAAALPFTLSAVSELERSLRQLILAAARSVVQKKAIAPGRYRQFYRTHAAELQGLVAAIASARRAYTVCRSTAPPSSSASTAPDTADRRALRLAWRAAEHAYTRRLRVLQRAEWMSIVDRVGMDSADRSSVAWTSFRRTLPAGAPGASHIHHPVTGMPPATLQEGNDNLALHYSRVSSCATYCDVERADERDAAIIDSVAAFAATLAAAQPSATALPCPPLAAAALPPAALPLLLHGRPEPPVPLSETEFTVEDLDAALGHVAHDKAYGVDDIDGYMLLHGGPLLTRCYLLLFNACWQHGVLPRAWTSANVFPLYKDSGSQHDASSYRPISLTCYPMRWLEKVVYARILPAISARLHPAQAGFRRSHSTEDNLYRLLDSFYTAASATTNSRGMALPVVFLDLQKAFDRMDVPSVLYKLHTAFGFSPSSRTLCFFRAFLSHRRLRTLSSYGGTSAWYPVDCGTPQGTVLGPLLFSVYINDLVAALAADERCTVAAFADDLLLIPAHHTTQPIAGPRGDVEAPGLLCDKLEALQHSLRLCGDWARNWRMSFGKSKTNLLVFRKHTALTPACAAALSTHPLTLTQSSRPTAPQNFRLDEVSSYKYMGVTVHHAGVSLFSAHATATLATLHARAKLVRRAITPHMPPAYSRLLVRSYVLSAVFYAAGFVRLSVTDARRLDAALRSTLCRIVSAPSHARVAVLRLALGMPAWATEHESQLMQFVRRITERSPPTQTTQLWQAGLHAPSALAPGSFNLSRVPTAGMHALRPLAIEYSELTGLSTPVLPTFWALVPFPWTAGNQLALARQRQAHDGHADYSAVLASGKPAPLFFALRLPPSALAVFHAQCLQIAGERSRHTRRFVAGLDSTPPLADDGPQAPLPPAPAPKARRVGAQAPLLSMTFARRQQRVSADCSLQQPLTLPASVYAQLHADSLYYRVDSPQLARRRTQLRVECVLTRSYLLHSYCNDDERASARSSWL